MYAYPNIKAHFRSWLVIYILIAATVAANRTTAQRVDTSRIMEWIQLAKPLRNTNPDSAARLLQQAAGHSRSLKYQQGMAWSYLLQGEILVDKGDYERALQLYDQALVYSKQAKDSTLLRAIIYIDRGTVFEIKGDPASVSVFLKALSYIDHLTSGLEQDRLRTTVYANLSNALLREQQFKKGLYYLEKGEVLAEKYKFYSLLVHILLNKGTAFKGLDMPDKAIIDYRKALKLAKQYKLSDFEKAAYSNIGQLLMSQNKDSTAVTYFKRAIEIDDGANPYYSSSILELLGNAYIALEQYDSAEHILLSAVAIAEKYGLKSTQLSLQLKLSSMYERSGKYQLAFKHQKAAIALSDDSVQFQKTREMQELETKYRTALKDKELVQKQVLLNRKNTLILLISAGTLLVLVVAFAYIRNHNRLHSRRIYMLEQESEIKALKAMMAGEEKERLRISQELHDGIGGMLSVLNMNLSTIQKKKYVTAEAPLQDLNNPLAMIQDIASEIRRTSGNLMPEALLKYGLVEAVNLYCMQLESSSPIEFDLQTYGALDSLEKSVALIIYRMIQELLQNIVKHSNASLAVIQIRQHESKLTLHVEDNGRGFDPEHHSSGLGLKNLQARVDALKGYVSISSSEHSGTTVYIECNDNLHPKIENR